MSIYTMSDELLGLARADVIRRLGSALRLETELIKKVARYDTEVARRKRIADAWWEEDTGPIDTLEERVE